MSELIKAEFWRLASRRLSWALLTAMAVMGALVALSAADRLNPDVSVGSQAWKNFQFDLDYWKQNQAACTNDTSEACNQIRQIPQPTWETWLPPAVDYDEYLLGGLNLAGPFALVAGALLAASFIGAEFTSGSLGTQLTFTPRRLPLMDAKLIVGTVGALTLMLTFLLSLLTIGTITFLMLRGVDDLQADAALPLMLGRLVVLALLIGVLAAGLTIGFGSSLMTAGTLIAVLMGATIADSYVYYTGSVLYVLPQYLLMALLGGESRRGGYDGIPEIVVSYPWALGFSSLVIAVVLVLAAWRFSRRDILR